MSSLLPHDLSLSLSLSLSGSGGGKKLQWCAVATTEGRHPTPPGMAARAPFDPAVSHRSAPSSPVIRSALQHPSPAGLGSASPGVDNPVRPVIAVAVGSSAKVTGSSTPPTIATPPARGSTLTPATRGSVPRTAIEQQCLTVQRAHKIQTKAIPSVFEKFKKFGRNAMMRMEEQSNFET
jgi:hypothetical protein